MKRSTIDKKSNSHKNLSPQISSIRKRKLLYNLKVNYLQMKPITFIIYVFLLFNLISCNSPQNNKSYYAEKRFIDLDKNKEYKFSELFDKVELIPLETKDSSLLGDDIKCKYLKDRFVFITNKSAYFFQPDGKFVDKLFHFGKSPSEYLDLTDIFLTRNDNSELINIYDRKNKRILSYDKTMTFTQSKNIEVKAYNAISFKSQYLLYQGGFADDGYMLKILDSSGNVTKKLIEQKEYFKNYYYFMDSNNFFQSDDNLVFWNSPNAIVYNIKDDLLEERYNFDFGKYSLPESFLDKRYFDIMEFNEALKKKNYVFPFLYNENSRTIAFHLMKGKSNYWYLYDKNKNEEFIANGFYDDMYFNTKIDISTIRSFPSLYLENKVIFIVDAFKVKEYLEQSKSNHTLDPKSININNNPYLLIGYLK